MKLEPLASMLEGTVEVIVLRFAEAWSRWHVLLAIKEKTLTSLLQCAQFPLVLPRMAGHQ
jgi:hypothetical protein